MATVNIGAVIRSIRNFNAQLIDIIPGNRFIPASGQSKKNMLFSQSVQHRKNLTVQLFPVVKKRTVQITDNQFNHGTLHPADGAENTRLAGKFPDNQDFARYARIRL